MKKYRKNVGIIVSKKGKVLLCARSDCDGFSWQFPQGGIDENEDIVEAGKRELFEETGITNIKLVQLMPYSIKYDFPTNNKNHCIKGFDGQDQSWVLFEFYGNDDEIKLDTTPECVEFKAFKWDSIDVAPTEIIPFKKNVYEQVVEYFKPFIKE